MCFDCVFIEWAKKKDLLSSEIDRVLAVIRKENDPLILERMSELHHQYLSNPLYTDKVLEGFLMFYSLRNKLIN